MQLSSYIVCGTPRSGSTLLCGMLTETRVAGCPHSYFRQEDIAEWAEEWGVEPARGPDDVQFDKAYVTAMRRVGTDDTGTFGLRLMWSSVADASRRLDNITGGKADIAVVLQSLRYKRLQLRLPKEIAPSQCGDRPPFRDARIPFRHG